MRGAQPLSGGAQPLSGGDATPPYLSAVHRVLAMYFTICLKTPSTMSAVMK